MSDRRPLSRHERTTIVNGILCIVLTLVLMQLWLISATMNAWLSGDDTIVWPAAIASAGCLLLNAGLLWYLFQLDR
jgi:type IV secretory pathway TrbD component